MTPRYKYRVALFICLLLIGEEFTRARNLNNQLQDHLGEKKKDIEPTTENSDDVENYTREELQFCEKMDKESKEARSKISHPIMDQLHRQSLKEEGGGKKGWITSFFKGVQIFTTGFNFVLTGAQIAQSIQKAVDGCCGPADSKECSYAPKFEEANKEVGNLSKVADYLQLEARKAQKWIGATVDRFSDLLVELRRIEAFQEQLIQEISPDIKAGMMEANYTIQKLIKEKNKTLERITFVEVDRLYQTTLQKATGIGGSVLSLAIPGISAIYQYAKHKSRMRRLGYIEFENEVEFELPEKSSSSDSLYKASKFNRWTSRRLRKNLLPKNLINNAKEFFKHNFKRVKRLAKTFVGPILTVANLAMAGYQIYAMIKVEQDCKKTRDQIKCAYIQTKEAQKTIEGHIDEIKEASTVMTDAWGIMRGNLTDEMLLSTLNSTASSLTGAGKESAEMETVKDDILEFIDEIKASDDYNATDKAINKLLQGLGRIPFTLKCFENKIRILSTVINGCKKGDHSLEQNLKDAREFTKNLDPNDVQDPENCKGVLGYLYVEDDVIKDAWYQVADAEGYHRLCLMNNANNRGYICRHMKTDKMKAEEIATGLKQVAEDEVQVVMDVLKKTLSPEEHRTVCEKRLKLSTKKQKRFWKYYFRGYQIDFDSVECPGPTKLPLENCIQDEAFSPKQIEREKKLLE